MSLIDVMGP